MKILSPRHAGILAGHNLLPLQNPYLTEEIDFPQGACLKVWQGEQVEGKSAKQLRGMVACE